MFPKIFATLDFSDYDKEVSFSHNNFWSKIEHEIK